MSPSMNTSVSPPVRSSVGSSMSAPVLPGHSRGMIDSLTGVKAPLVASYDTT